MKSEIRGNQIKDESIKRVDIQLNYNSDGALRAEDIPYNNLSSVKSKIDSLNLSDLSDVVLSDSRAGQIIKYNGTNWINSTVSGIGANYLDSLVDVILSGIVVGNVLKYNGTDWVNSKDLLSKLSDTSISNPVSKQILKHNGTNWINSQETLNDIKNVVISSVLTQNDFIKWNGSDWVNWNFVLSNGSVTSNKLSANSILTSKIADANVTSNKLASNSVTSNKITTDAITSSKLIAGSIVTTKIANANVTSVKLASGSVLSGKLATGSVITSKIADANVTSNKLASNSVTSNKITTGSILTSKIADANVTSNKLAANSIVTAKIANANITSAKLATGSVLSGKIGTNAITSSKIISNAITNSKIISNAVDGTKLRLKNDEWLRARNAANSADINIIKVSGSNSIIPNFGINDLDDTTISSLANKQLLKYNGSKWINSQGTLNDIKNVIISSPVLNHVLKYNGTDWINSSGGGTGGANYVDDLYDVVISTLVSGQILQHNGTNWVNQTNNIDNLSDVNLSSVTSGQILQHNGTNWTNQTNNIDNLSDVSISSVISGQILQHNGTNWVNQTNNIDNLSDVNISSITSGQTLYYNGSQWINKTPYLNDFNEVILSSVAAGQVIQYNGTNWVNQTNNLNNITNISAAYATSGQILQYNGTHWINSAAATKGLAAKREIFDTITSATLSIDLSFQPWSVDCVQLILNSEVITNGASLDWRLSTNGKRVLLSSALRPLISTGDYIEAKYLVAETDTMGMVSPRCDRFTSSNINNAQISFSLSGKPINANAIQVDVNGTVLHQYTHWNLAPDGQTLLVDGYTLSSSDEMQVKYLEGQENYAITAGAYIFFKQERLTADAGLISCELSQYPATISSVNVFRNGIFEENGFDYDVVGKKIVFSSQISSTDEVIVVYGKYQSGMKAVNERPSGLYNGTNKSYTITNNPIGKDAIVLFYNGVFQEQQTVYSSVWAGKDYRMSGLTTIVTSTALSVGVLASYYYTTQPDLITTMQDGILNHLYLRDKISSDNIYKLVVSAGTLVISRV